MKRTKPETSGVSVFCRPWLLIMFSFAGLAVASGAGASDTLNMSANIVQSACTISFVAGESSTGTAITTISVPEADSSQLVSTSGECSDNKCIDTTNSQPVTLKLSQCGVAMEGTTPTVTLTGVNAVSADIKWTVASSLPFMFRDTGSAGGTSREYAIVLGKQKNMTWGTTTGTGLYNTTTDNVMPLTGAGKGTSGEGASSTFWLAVSCGYGCQAPDARAGTLNASLTFSFTYK